MARNDRGVKLPLKEDQDESWRTMTPEEFDKMLRAMRDMFGPMMWVLPEEIGHHKWYPIRREDRDSIR